MSSRGDAHRMRRMLGALVVVALMASGCGVPGSSDAEEVEDAPGFNGPAAPAETVELPVPTREDRPPDLVRKFLQIGAAADWSTELLKEERIQAAVKYAEKFLTSEGKETWKPVSTSIDVIQVLDLTERIDSVVVKYRRVGVLDRDGTLTPAAVGLGEESLEFQVAPLGDSGPRLLTSAPNNLLPLSLDGLHTLFEVRPVYYWEPLNRFLVPDRRYLSRGISQEKRVKAIVERVLVGPSPFLSKAVRDPLAKAPRGNTVLNGINVVVDLPVSEQTEQAQSLERLATQLRWSLHPNRYSVELLVEGRKARTFSGSDYELANPSQSPSANRNNGQRLYSNDQRQYAAVDGSVKPLQPGETPPSILSLPQNANVVSAAVNIRQNSAALVRQVGGQKSLWVGRTPADGSAAQFRQVAFGRPVSTFSRPTYLPGAGDRVLIVADGRLYDVDLGSGEAIELNQQPIAGLPVAVSVAPDGARVAIVTASKAYVTTIDPTKRPVVINTNPSAPVQEVFVGTLTDLRGVGWFYEHQIAVGGRSGIVIAAIDGGGLEQMGPDNLLGVQLTQLSAVPWNPIGGEGGNLVFEALAPPSNTAAAYVSYRTDLVALKAPPTPGATPVPSVSASGTGTPPVPKVTAPFYADVV